MATNTWLKRGAFALFAILFVAAAVLVVMLPEPLAERPVAERLPDGRVIRVEDITVGKSHVFRTGPEWLEKLQAALPRSLRAHLGTEVRTMHRTTSEVQVMPWISLTRGSKNSPVWNGLHVVADSGETFDIGNRSYPGTFGDRRFMLPGLSVFPRRDPSFTITGLVDRLPFSLRIPNPLHGRTIAEWNPLPMPATNRVGGFDIELAEANFNQTDSGEHFSMRLRAFEDGEFLNDWFNFSWSLGDATGNQSHQLPTNEPAWRANVTLSRKFAARWATNEYREFPLAELPPDGGLREIDLDVELNGTRVRRLWIGGAGKFVMKNGVFTEMGIPSSGGGDRSSWSSRGGSDFEMTFTRANPWILVHHASRLPGHTLAAFLVDAEGKEISVQRGGGGSDRFPTESFQILPPKGGFRFPLTLRIAGDQQLRTEFTFSPAQLRRIDRRRR